MRIPQSFDWAILFWLLAPGFLTAAPPVPHNIILMIGDGCGFNHLTAANFWRHGKDSAVYQTFPVRGAISTWSLNGHGYSPEQAAQDFTYVMKGYTDSGASGTAFSTGRKTYNASISTDANGTPMLTITEWAHANRKRSGVVSSVHFANATPAAMAAHQSSRGDYEEIAREMLTASPLSVIITPSHPEYTDDGIYEPDTGLHEYHLVGGREMWQKLRTRTLRSPVLKKYWTLIEETASLDSLARGLRQQVPLPLIGIPKVRTTLQQRRSAETPNPGLPDLATLSLAALNVLNQDSSGFFLMIEGGAIDWASHQNQSQRMIEETTDFLVAIDSVVSWIERHGGWERNLLVITADHETGYLTGPDFDSGQPWYRDESGRVILSPIVNRGAGVLPDMRWNSGQHTNQLVPLFAKGAGSREILRDQIGIDPLRGPYSDNALVGLRIRSLWAIPPPQSWRVVNLIPAPAPAQPTSQ